MHKSIEGFTLYGDPISGNCLKVKWVADYLQIPYKWVTVDVANGETRQRGFLDINPQGKVPYLSWPDGRSLSESNASMLLLAESASDHPLIPPSAYERADMYRWLFWEQYSHEPAIAVRRFRKHYLHQSDDELDPALLTKGYAALDVIEERLGQADYLVGETMTLADVALIAYTRVAPEGGYDLGRYPQIGKWLDRVADALGID